MKKILFYLLFISILGGCTSIGDKEDKGKSENTCEMTLNHLQDSVLYYKRYCQTLSLKNSKELIVKYDAIHGPAMSWPEIEKGIRYCGIMNMQIFRYENKCLMIVDAPLDFNWNKAMTKLAKLPRQSEWEAFVSKLQGVSANASSDEKWQMMECVYRLKNKKVGKAIDGLIEQTYRVRTKYVCQMIDKGNKLDVIKILHNDKVSLKSEIRVREAGIYNMEIFIHGNSIFLVYEVPDNFEKEIQTETLIEVLQNERFEGSITENKGPGLVQNWHAMKPIFKLGW